MRGRIDEIFFDPEIFPIVFKEHAAFGDGQRQRDKRLFGGALMSLVQAMSVCPQQK